jgi:hypothetical protein
MWLVQGVVLLVAVCTAYRFGYSAGRRDYE